MRPLGIFALALAACTLPERGVNEDGGAVNACSVEEEIGGACGTEGICLRGRCHALAVSDTSIVFEIVRSQVSGVNPGQSHFFFSVPSLDGLRTLDRSARALDFSAPAFAPVEVTLLTKKNTITSARNCTFPDLAQNLSLPFHATLRPSASLRGLPVPTVASSARDPNSISPPLSLKATLSAAPALYDLYLQPEGNASCPIPPLLRFGVSVREGVANIISIPLPDSSRLGGTITAPVGLDLSTWRLHLAELTTGLRVSTVAGLIPESDGVFRIGTPYDKGIAPIEFYRPAVPADAPPSTLFLVLSPPEGLAAPRLAWDLSVLDLSNSGQISVDLSALDLSLVQVELRAARSDPPAGQKASISLESLLEPGALKGAPAGAIAAFSSGPALSGDDGVGLFVLPPGRYDGVAVASKEPLDIGRKSFEFVPNPQDPASLLAGFTVDLAPRPAVDITVLPPLDETPPAGVSYELFPASTAPSFAPLFGRARVAPRGASGVLSSAGKLLAPTDSGLFHLVVRFPESSGFPWLVKPSVLLPLPTPAALRASLPVEVTGSIFDLPLDNPRRRPLFGATVRAYARAGDAFVPVAVSRINSAGNYRLALPSRL